MTTTPLLRSLSALCLLWALLSASGCALLSRPAPLATLQLEPPPAASTWPTMLEPGRVTAVAALQTDRIVVADGALLMQHQGLRWVEVPATMMAEYLHRLHARRPAGSAATGADLASFDLWLTDFNLRLDADGERNVVVAASAQLRCGPAAPVRPLTPASATLALEDDSAGGIAATFSAAVHQVLATLLSAASNHAGQPCFAP